MNRRLPKLWQQAAVALLAVIFSALIPLSTVYADDFPYFNTQNGGPFTGGWFDSETDPNYCSSNYQTPDYDASTSLDQYYGAIMAWATPSRTGAHSSLDAYAIGKIEGKSPENYGFYTGLSGTSALSFSNFNTLNVSDFWGGIFEGAPLGPNHCIPDYQSFGESPVSWQGFNNATDDGQYSFGGGPLTGDVLPGRQIILFSDGDVRITGNIQYQGGYNMDDVTKFVLVVKGNIYVDDGVSRMDGWYIAQPDPSSINNTGVIWTCTEGNGPPPVIFMRNNCNGSLEIRGAFTAKQVNLGRINGNIGGDSAEVVNFTPEMILGGPFFEDDTPSTAGAIQSLISLPPVF